MRREALLAVVALSAGCGGSGPGPLADVQAGPERVGLAGLTDLGKRHTFSDLLVVNEGDEPVTLREVELVDPTPGIKIVGALAAERGRSGMIASAGSFPPRGERGFELGNLRELAGYIVPPATTVPRARAETQIFVGVAVDGEGRFEFHGVRVRYSAGDRIHVLEIPYRVAYCAPREKHEIGECEAKVPGDP